MTDSGLMEDDDSLTPTIIEIPLKQLTVNVEQGTSHLQMDNSVESSVLNRNSHNSTIDMKVVPDISSGETSSPDSDDSLIRNNEKVADKSLPNIYKISGPILPLQTLKCSPSSSSRRLQKCSRDHRRRRSRHQAEMVSSSELQNNQVRVYVEDNGTELEYHSEQPAQQLFDDHSTYTTTRDYLPNSSNIHHLYSESSLLSDSVANDLVSRYIAKHQLPVTIANSTDNRVRFSDYLPQKFSMNPCGQRENAEDCTVSDDADEENVLCEEQTPTVLGDHSHLQKTISDDSHNLAGAGASASNYSNKALLPKTNNIRLAQSLLHKTRSYQDHLCSAADSAQAEASIGPFSLDSVTKEELLVLWKSSEIELTKRLEAALKEKSRLERKLAMLQKHSLV